MIEFIAWILFLIALFSLVNMAIVQFRDLPKGNFSTYSARYLMRFTGALDNPKTLAKVIYWAAPVLVFLFFSFNAGVLMIIGVFYGRFLRRRVQGQIPTADPVTG